MFLIGEIGGRRQRARVSSPRMHAAGRRTMYVHIPGLQRTQLGGQSSAASQPSRTQYEVSQEPAAGLGRGSQKPWV